VGSASTPRFRPGKVSRDELFPKPWRVFARVHPPGGVAVLHWAVPLIAIVLALLVSPFVEAQAPALPTEIPLFPLPETSLFPGVSRPFLIFEPRYREMIADALKGDLIIGMVRLRPGFEKDYEGRPPVYSIGCAGIIDKYEQLPDGRYVILLRGLTTFRLVSEDQRKPYRLARIEIVPELVNDDERVTLSALRNRVDKLLDAVLPLTAEPPDPALDDAEFVNIVAQNLGMPESARQELLERNRVVERARALVEILEQK
jgi:Lon protease-like protein